jgi:predicted nucleic acid-binding protein
MIEYVFDTSALLAYIEDEDGSQQVETLFMKALDGDANIYISVVTFVEIFYISMREQGIKIAEERIKMLSELPLIQEPLTHLFTKLIGEIKATKPMSFADCCIAGLAKFKNAILVHKDPEFEQLENMLKQYKLPYKIKITH